MTKYSYIIGIFTVGLLLTACRSYDEDALDESQQKVTAQIALSVSGKTDTRMTTDATQADEAFKGMQDITLLLFGKSGTNDNPIELGDHCISSPVLLPYLPANGLYSNNSKLYYDISIPIGINAFLVYGRSLAETNGALTPSPADLNADPANISFSPVQFVSSVTTGHAAGEKGDNIINYLNGIFKTNDNFDWSNETSCPILYGLYPLVQNMKAGSTASVKAFVQVIYEALKESAGVGYVQNVLKAILVEDLNEGNLPSTLPTTVTLPDNCQGYPADCGLPDGAAVVEWDETNKEFKAVTDKNNLGAMNVDVRKFVKPAELWYRSNSRINTDIISHQEDYENKNTWGLVLAEYSVQRGTVNPTTKSIAIRQELNYAVSRLDLRLEAKNGSATLTKLVDKAGTEFNLADLPITGILVGQQSPVDYLFQSKWQQDTDPLYTIYDNAIQGTINAATNVYTHTLVLETAKDQTVNVAIELQNNSGKSILTRVPGDEEDQIIPNGCKFYLIGQLVIKSEDGNGGYTYIENYSETDPAKNRVFCQDHVTQVTFTVNDLTKAYYVIPPLSSTKLEFSLSVANWKISTSVGHELEYNED